MPLPQCPGGPDPGREEGGRRASPESSHHSWGHRVWSIHQTRGLLPSLVPTPRPVRGPRVGGQSRSV